MKSAYIIFEGTVGTGKSTQAKRLYDFLKERYPKKQIILTREPGGDEIAESIRKLVQGTEFKQDMVPECEAYLYAAARAQSLRSVVKPCLDAGGIVISDRSYLTSLAYQGYAREVGIKKVLDINKEAIEGFSHGLILYIELDPEQGLKRTFDKGGDKFEKLDCVFFKKVQEGYKKISQMPQFKGNWVNIDGKGDKNTVFERIKEKIMGFLQED
jgi:dTMP kinase